MVSKKKPSVLSHRLSENKIKAFSPTAKKESGFNEIRKELLDFHNSVMIKWEESQEKVKKYREKNDDDYSELIEIEEDCQLTYIKTLFSIKKIFRKFIEDYRSLKLQEAKIFEKVCANLNCKEIFYATSQKKKYCTSKCEHRAREKRYRLR